MIVFVINVLNTFPVPVGVCVFDICVFDIYRRNVCTIGIKIKSNLRNVLKSKNLRTVLCGWVGGPFLPHVKYATTW